MRVLWFTNTPVLRRSQFDNPSGGTGGWIEALEEKISQRGEIELGVCFHSSSSEGKDIVANKTSYFAIPPHANKRRLSGLIDRLTHRIDSIDVVDPYLDVVRKFKPDIIHIFGTEGPFGLIIPSVRIPVIIHFQGNINVIEKKWFIGVSPLDVLRNSRLRDLIKGRGFLHEYLLMKKKSKREQAILTHCRYLMGRTDWDRRVSLCLSPNSKYYHCDEILRKEYYSVIWHKKRAEVLSLFTTLRGNIYKGIETIYDAAYLLSKSDMQFEWRVAGVSEKDEIARIMTRRFRRADILGKVKLMGYQNAEQIAGLLLASDVFVYCSHIENGCNAVQEAMLVGMPIVTSSAGGLQTTIENGITGFLVQDGDPYAFTGAILQMRDNPGLAKELGKNARERALKRHDPNRIVSDVINIYEDVLKYHVQ